MSDDEDLDLEGGGVGGESGLEVGQKTGLVPGLIIQILKWAALGLAAVILIVTVVIITLTVWQGGRQPQTLPFDSKEMSGPPPVYAWYNQIPEIRARTEDQQTHTVIVKVSIAYDPRNKRLYNELVDRTPRLQDLIRSFFGKKTANELRPEYDDAIKQELKEVINDILINGRIKEVIFTDFNVVEF